MRVRCRDWRQHQVESGHDKLKSRPSKSSAWSVFHSKGSAGFNPGHRHIQIYRITVDFLGLGGLFAGLV
jgi:hypothetical protein